MLKAAKDSALGTGMCLVEEDCLAEDPAIAF